jgi:hypothetical protein
MRHLAFGERAPFSVALEFESASKCARITERTEFLEISCDIAGSQPVAHALPARGLDGALADGELGVGHHQLLRELPLEAQAVAGGAGPKGGVEGEGAGLQLLEGEVVLLVEALPVETVFAFLVADGIDEQNQ